MSFYNVEIDGVCVGRVQGDDDKDAMARDESTYCTQSDGTIKKCTVRRVDVKHPLVEKVDAKNAKEK